MGSKFGPNADIDWPVLRLYLTVILLAFVVLTGRLFYLQVMKHREFQQVGLRNIIADVPIPGPRGDIYDRAGRPLAKSVNVFGLMFIPPRGKGSSNNYQDIEYYFDTDSEPQRMKIDGEEVLHHYLNSETGKVLGEIQLLASYLGQTYPELMSRIEEEWYREFSYQPLLIVDELTQEQVIHIEENRDKFPSVYIERYNFKRVYPQKADAVHLLGYIGMVNPETDPRWITELGYGPRESVGKNGLEQMLERELHGTQGRRDIKINRARHFEKIAREVPPRKGTDVYLTINKNLQAKAAELLGARPGAIIVSSLAPGTAGEILACVSSPGYDPNRIREGDYYATLLEHPHLPLLNRAVGNAFPPGSTFKIVTAALALQEGLATPGTGFNCEGYVEIGKYERRYHCHNRFGHGQLTFMEGIAESCDVVFYELGLKLARREMAKAERGEYYQPAPEIIKDYALRFGYGEKTGIRLPAEASGVLPDPAWKEAHYSWANPVDQAWYTGDTITYMIGQSYLLSTPLQVLMSVNVAALDGMWYPPQLMKARNVAGMISHNDPPEPEARNLNPDVLRLVCDGMRMAVTDGTAEALDLPGLRVAAKTGTAQTGKEGEEDHSWVCGYYPVGAPEYSFVVFFQNGGSSGEAAVPAARELLEYMHDTPPVGTSKE